MKGLQGKISRIITKIEELTEELNKNPKDEMIREELKKAEDKLCTLIKENEKEIDELLTIFNETDAPEWDE